MKVKDYARQGKGSVQYSGTTNARWIWQVDNCAGRRRHQWLRGTEFSGGLSGVRKEPKKLLFRYPFAFFTSSINGGTISNKFPTTAKSAISKIGASESLLMATMLRAPFIPTMC